MPRPEGVSAGGGVCGEEDGAGSEVGGGGGGGDSDSGVGVGGGGASIGVEDSAYA